MTLVFSYTQVYSNVKRPTVSLPLTNYSQGRITMDLTRKLDKKCKSCSG